MKTQRKILTATIVLTMALGVGAVSAMAAQFHTSSGSASLVGAQEETFNLTLQGSSLTCSTVKMTGTSAASGTSETQQLHPEFSGCTAFGLSGATVSTAGCQFQANASSSSWSLQSCSSGYTTINWENGVFGRCHIDIPNQNGINGFVAINTNFRRLLKWSFNANNIHYTVTVSNGLCPLSTGTGTTATLIGGEGITANGGAVQIWAE
jgi:hypothetical protein